MIIGSEDPFDFVIKKGYDYLFRVSNESVNFFISLNKNELSKLIKFLELTSFKWTYFVNNENGIYDHCLIRSDKVKAIHKSALVQNSSFFSDGVYIPRAIKKMDKALLYFAENY
jgi:hypothetical protein